MHLSISPRAAGNAAGDSPTPFAVASQELGRHNEFGGGEVFPLELHPFALWAGAAAAEAAAVFRCGADMTLRT